MAFIPYANLSGFLRQDQVRLTSDTKGAFGLFTKGHRFIVTEVFPRSGDLLLRDEEGNYLRTTSDRLEAAR